MKQFVIGMLSALVLVCFAAAACAQAGPRGTSSITVQGKNISVEYGRPSLRGRGTDELLGQLPAGGFWRMGSNKSTTFKTDVDLDFGGVAVPAGEYSIWMQKEADNSWKLVFNKQHGQWGTQHDTAQDIATVPLTESKSATPAEMVTLTLRKAGNGGMLTIQWGTMEDVAKFMVK
jgi:hypothetical protein